ncbi:MAG: cytochrome c1, partial [Alphaproteobacteria bacterium]|nr:cytochrome c1 [Alphaproteobacteria bacterium]
SQNNGAVPPDLSLITKAREDGSNYVPSLVTGYTDFPAAQAAQFPDTRPDNNHYYNPYFSALNIAMPPPLKVDGLVSYKDGTVATREQMATDVGAFLTWAAEPKLEQRHHVGIASVIYLFIFAVLAYMSYRTIWGDKKH